MTTFSSGPWTSFTGAEPRGLFVLVDPQVGQARGQLRSLALLTELGLSNVTYNYIWHTDLRPVPYVYLKLGPGRAEPLLAERGHLVQVISQETIDYSAYDFTWELIRYALRPGPGQPLVVLVVDRPNLVLPGAADGKSIFEDMGLFGRGAVLEDYSVLFRRYLRRVGSPIRQRLTENLYFHRLAAELARAGWTEFGRITDLFRLQSDSYPLTPLIRSLLAHFLENAERREELEYRKGPPFIMEEMRGWLERGEAGAMANALWYGMALFDFDPKKLYRWKGEDV
ncbi:MAG TPA: hypothetical protein VD969_23410 [Symbiobacteriaceae bacterium]|nr:hypothetical protein [Symbiobacteriaceae bacterium]